MSVFEHSIDIAAPVGAVFAAFRDPERLATWWGPDGFTNSFETCDFVPGGQWKYTMHGPDGRDYPNESRFEDVVPNRLIRIRHVSLPRYDLDIELLPTDGTTRVSWRGVFENETFAEKMRDFLETANQQNLNRLAAEVLAKC